MKSSSKIDMQQHTALKTSLIETPLGNMYAIADDERLYLLEFADRNRLAQKIEKLRVKKMASIIQGQAKPIALIKEELMLYFSGRLKEFKTPIHMLGSDFQKKAWNELIKIPYGQTRSYLSQAKAIGNHNAFRAVANANGANQLAIIIPCHRIINNNGNLGGYGGGIAKKQWLINHEKRFKDLKF